MQGWINCANGRCGNTHSKKQTVLGAAFLDKLDGVAELRGLRSLPRSRYKAYFGNALLFPNLVRALRDFSKRRALADVYIPHGMTLRRIDDGGQSDFARIFERGDLRKLA